jgi:hypothetical protein
MNFARRFFVPMFLTWLMFYLFGAFGSWDINPGEWRECTRWLVTSLAAFFGVVAGSVFAGEAT